HGPQHHPRDAIDPAAARGTPHARVSDRAVGRRGARRAAATEAEIRRDAGRHSVSLRRIRPTTSSARRVKAKVVVNRIEPTRKSAWYHDPSLGTAPSSAAIVAVMVRTLTNGFSVTWAAFPVARRTIIVSPSARPMPSSIAAVTPETAAGSTTRDIA